MKNILVRIPGSGNTSEAVLLASHYDSMPTTPAAADGAVSVATLLETVRAIQAGPPLKNDVIVYVGDADVNSVLGPIAFHKHPWSRDAGVGSAFEGIRPLRPERAGLRWARSPGYGHPSFRAKPRIRRLPFAAERLVAG